MRRLGLVIVFILFAIGGLVAFAPLSFLMKKSGVGGQGVEWSESRGTIWNGQVSGLAVDGRPAGNVEVRLTLPALVSGRGHEVKWSALYGQARANIRVSPKSLQIVDLIANVEPSKVSGLDPRLAALAGIVSVRDGSVIVSRTGCLSAAGEVSTDLARLVALRFGRDWPILTGALVCLGGELGADLSGEAPDGTQIRAEIRGSRTLKVVVSRTSPDVVAGLQLAGFMPSAEGAELNLETSPVGIQP